MTSQATEMNVKYGPSTNFPNELGTLETMLSDIFYQNFQLLYPS